MKIKCLVTIILIRYLHSIISIISNKIIEHTSEKLPKSVQSLNFTATEV